MGYVSLATTFIPSVSMVMVGWEVQARWIDGRQKVTCGSCHDLSIRCNLQLGFHST